MDEGPGNHVSPGMFLEMDLPGISLHERIIFRWSGTDTK